MASKQSEPATATAGAAKKVSTKTFELANKTRSSLQVFDDEVIFKDDRMEKEESFPSVQEGIHILSQRAMTAQLPESYDEEIFELNRALVADLKLLRQMTI